MKILKHAVVLAGVATLLSLAAGNLSAQERRNFDPEEMRQRMMDRYREQLEVKNDDEWKLLSERITKVSDARRDLGGPGGFGRGGFGRRGGDGAPILTLKLSRKPLTRKLRLRKSRPSSRSTAIPRRRRKPSSPKLKTNSVKFSRSARKPARP